MPDGLAALASLGGATDPAEWYPFPGIRFIGCGASVEAVFLRARA